MDIWFFSLDYNPVLLLFSNCSHSGQWDLPQGGPCAFLVRSHGFGGPFLTFRHHRVLRLVLGFPAPALESATSAGALLPVIKEWDVKARVWE